MSKDVTEQKAVDEAVKRPVAADEKAEKSTEQKAADDDVKQQIFAGDRTEESTEQMAADTVTVLDDFDEMESVAVSRRASDVLDTVLLLTFDSDFGDSSSYARSIKVEGNPTIEVRVDSFGISRTSMCTDTSAGYLRVAPDSAFSFADRDFTWEAWVYPNSASLSHMGILCLGGYAPLEVLASGIVRFFSRNGYGASSDMVGLLNGPSMQDLTWQHVALSRASTDIYLWINGELAAQTTVPSTIPGCEINCPNGGRNAVPDAASGLVEEFQVMNRGDLIFTGCIDDVRITSGSALYTAAFQPPFDGFQAAPTPAPPPTQPTPAPPTPAPTPAPTPPPTTRDASSGPPTVVAGVSVWGTTVTFLLLPVLFFAPL